jgi:stage III sporulation protein AF
MDWLGGWLKSVVTVLLLATFVDLLLPSSTMQRYVKTVLSLFILLTLLTPAIDLFEKKWNVDQLLASAEQKQLAAERGAAGKGNFPSLQAISQQAESLKSTGEKQVQQILQTQLAQQVKEDLQKQTKLRIDDVAVAVKNDNNGKPYIDHVRVTLHEIEKQAITPKNPGVDGIAVMKPVQPVEPVNVDISQKQTEVIKKNPVSLSPELEREKLKIANLVIKNWQVDPDRIDIKLQ